MFAASYTREELADLVAGVQPRRGWDFARMSVSREPVPWEYTDVVRRHLEPAARVLDIGTGGGEQLGSDGCSLSARPGPAREPGRSPHPLRPGRRVRGRPSGRRGG